MKISCWRTVGSEPSDTLAVVLLVISIVTLSTSLVVWSLGFPFFFLLAYYFQHPVVIKSPREEKIRARTRLVSQVKNFCTLQVKLSCSPNDGVNLGIGIPMSKKLSWIFSFCAASTFGRQDEIGRVVTWPLFFPSLHYICVSLGEIVKRREVKS